MDTTILETTRLLLRPFCTDDAQDVFSCWESDPNVSKYMFWESHNDINKSIDWVKAEVDKISSDDWYRWAIVLKETQELIGTCLIYFENEYRKYEVAYNLGSKFWGHGYIPEALNKIFIFARDVLEIKEIMGRYAKENSASGKVMEKLGFTYIRDIPYECNEGNTVYEGVECIRILMVN